MASEQWSADLEKALDANLYDPATHKDQEALVQEVQGRLSHILSTEGREIFNDLVKDITNPTFLDQVQATKTIAEEGVDASEALVRQQQEFLSAVETGTLHTIAHSNIFAQEAITRSAERMKPLFEKMFSELEEIKATQPIGRHADLRTVPITSLMEYIRFAPEIAIAFVAGNSAKNMVLDLLGQWQSTQHLSYDTRKMLAIMAGMALSAAAYNLRHSLYKTAQEEGDKFMRSPLKRTGAVASSYARTLRKHPIRTSLATGSALTAAFAGGQILLHLVGTSEKSVDFGKTTLDVVRPLKQNIEGAGTVMDSFFKQIEERCRAIVDAEVDPTKAKAGTGKGALPSYGSKAAAKDFLCFGKTQPGKENLVPAALKTFRASINMADGVSISEFYRAEWEKTKTEREAALQSILEKLSAFNKLVEAEAATPLAEHLKNATLKHTPDRTVIPKAKVAVVEAIKEYLALINAFGAKVDGISRRIATEGIAAANAAGQDIEIQAPKVTIDVSQLLALPDSPTGNSGFFLNQETARGSLAGLEKIPVINFGASLLSKDSPYLPRQLEIIFALTYLGAEGFLTWLMVYREQQRRRRIERERDPKRRDYYTALDTLSRKIAEVVMHGILPFRAVVNDTVPEHYQTHEQLVSAIKVSITESIERDTKGSDLEYWKENVAASLTRGIKHLYDWGPEDRVELDTAIEKISALTKDLQGATPEECAAIIAELGVPGSSILSAIYNKELLQDKEKFATFIQNAEINAMQQTVQHLVKKMQARQYVLDQLSAEIEQKRQGGSEKEMLLHAEKVREFLSSGIILSLEGDSTPVATSVDEMRYFRVWSELAAEQEQDERDLFKVASAGRTMWDRKFRVDHSLGTVEIPTEFTQEFIAVAKSKHFSTEAMLVESYKQMVTRMLDHNSNDISWLTNTLDLLNRSSITESKRGLEDEPRLFDAYTFSFAATFSVKHGGPVVRCDVFDAETGNYTTSVEAPFILADAEMSKEQIDAKVAQWFSPDGPGRLEVIARARHHELRKLVTERFVEAATDEKFAHSQLTLSEASPPSASEIALAQKLILLKALLARQDLRINSVTQNHLQEPEMQLFELAKDLWEPNVSVSDIISKGKVSIDGIFQLELAARELPQKLPLHTIKVDLQRGFLVVTPKIVIKQDGIVSQLRSRFAKEAVQETRTFPLRELNDINRFVQKVTTPVTPVQ